MPAKSKAQQKFMGMVHAAQKGEKPASKAVANVAKNISKSAAKDFAKTKQKGLPNKVKKEEAILKLREYIRNKIMQEMNVTGNVQGYNTPHAFTKRGTEKKKSKKQADLTGYSVVNEAELKLSVRYTNKHGKEGFIQTGGSTNPKNWFFFDGKTKYPYEKVKKELKPAKDQRKTGFGDYLKQGGRVWDNVNKNGNSVNENRWLELKREDAPPASKIGRGISNINRQLAEVEKFLNWYGRIKQESGTTNEDFWKRTNRNIYKIKERLIKLEQQIRRFT